MISVSWTQQLDLSPRSSSSLIFWDIVWVHLCVLQCVCLCVCVCVCLCVLTSICVGNDVGDVSVWSEGEVEDVGGVVLAWQRVEHLAVNSDLDVLPLRVTHLKHTHKTHARLTSQCLKVQFEGFRRIFWQNEIWQHWSDVNEHRRCTRTLWPATRAAAGSRSLQVSGRGYHQQPPDSADTLCRTHNKHSKVKPTFFLSPAAASFPPSSHPKEQALAQPNS